MNNSEEIFDERGINLEMQILYGQFIIVHDTAKPRKWFLSELWYVKGIYCIICMMIVNWFASSFFWKKNKQVRNFVS